VIYAARWVEATPGTDVVSRLPDLSAIPGWQVSFGLTSTGVPDWQAGGDRTSAFDAWGWTVRRRGSHIAGYRDGDETTMATATATAR
jgi:hypothetical protein